MVPLSCAALPFAAGFLYNQYANRRDAKAYLPRGELVSILDCKFHVSSQGESRKGVPTVIVETGIWDCLESWQLVQSEIAKETRIITYDRPGYGFSEPSRYRRTFDTMASDLEVLLERIEAKPPYILVGHSMGGPIARYFQSRHSMKVAGIVLVDACNQKIAEFTKSTLFKVGCKAASLFSSFGAVRLVNWLFPLATKNPEWTPTMQKTYNACHRAKASAFTTCLREWAGCEESFKLLNEYARSLADIPVTVISRDLDMPQRPGMSATAIRKEKHDQKQLNRDHLEDAPHAKLVIAKGSGHLVQLDKPDIVIAEIKEMLKATTTS